MALTTGTRLGSYDVISLLGQGGMGEVYRAHDTKLNRDVALKILPSEFTHDPDRVARFRREAQVLASLNHPHIAAIHGLDEANGTQFLVLELVEGPTLADRIARGRVPLDEALPIARQVAEALEAAHEKEIIHRDLKPANIALTMNDQVKVLDFGLAKALEPEASGAELANSPTLITPAMTRMGVILGTAAYMSPEQARGRSVDKRSDIWAFGCVLFEMLTGARAFDGEDTTDILGSIIKTDPDWSRVPAATPPAVVTLLKRCLRKDRSQRLDSATAIRLEIDESGATAAAPVTTRGPHVLAIAAVAATLALAGGWTLGRSTAMTPAASPEDPVIVADITAPPGVISAFYDGFALSPDGATIVFVARDVSGRRQLWLRRISAAVAQPVSGTDGARYPFWSPDGAHIAFLAGGMLKRVPGAGGTAQVLAEARDAFHTGSWSDRDDIALMSNFFSASKRIWIVPAQGGPGVKFERPGARPHWVPGGAQILYAAVDGDRWALVSATPAEMPAQTTTPIPALALGPEAGYFYAPSGWVFINRNRTMTAQRFDAATATPVGTPLVLAGTVGTPRGWFALSAARDSLIALAHRSVDERGDPGDPVARLKWVNRAGEVVGTVGEPGRYWALSLAPDGERVLTRQADTLWLLSGRSTARIGAERDAAVWTPDGTGYVIVRGGEILKPAVTTSSEPVRLGTVAGIVSDWSPDGRSLLVTERPGSGNADVMVFEFAARATRPLIATPADERHPRYSPDGKWIAYTSDAGGRGEVFVTDSTAALRPMQVSEGGGQHPLWRGDGRELFFLGPNDEVIAAPVQPGGTLSFGRPTRLFQLPLNDITSDIWAPYAVTRDGQRFLLNVPETPSSLLYIRGFSRLAAR